MGVLDTVQNIINKIVPGVNDTSNTDNTGVSPSFQFQQSPYHQFRTQEECISFIKNEFERRQQERRPKEVQWQLNMNFLQGNQYCDINIVTQEIRQIDKVYDWQEREVYNQMAPIYETRLAKLGAVRPGLIVRPATNENESISTAKTCTGIVKGAYRAQNMSEHTDLATAWSELTGTVFYKHLWDPKSGRLIGKLDNKDVNEGDYKEVVCSSYEIFPDSNFSNGVDGCQSIMHAKAFSKGAIYMQWGVDVPGQEVDVFTLNQTNIGLGGLGYNSTIYSIASTKQKDSDIIIEFYSRPCKEFPQGIIIVMAYYASKLLYIGPLTILCDDDGKPGIPIDRQVCIEVPGEFWGESVLTRLIPVQRSYNAVKNRKHEYLNRLAIGILDVPDDGTYDTDDLEEEGLYPGKILRHPAGSNDRARFLENPNSSAEFAEEERSLENLFVQISGVSTFARESAPPVGANSGVAMEIVKEQDDTRLSLSAEQIRKCMVRRGKRILRFYKQYSKGPRVMRFVGENNDVIVLDWMADDITSDDVVCDTENELAQTIAQRKQMVIDLLNAGLFLDPDTGRLNKRMQAKIFEIMQLGNWESAVDMDDLHISRAQRENKFLEKGVIPQIKSYDDHSIHIEEHNRYRLTVDYDQLERMNPLLAQLFDLHVQMHIQQIMAITQPVTSVLPQSAQQTSPPSNQVTPEKASVAV